MGRLWNWIVYGAFALMLPIWIIEWGREIGYGNVALIILGLFLLGLWRGWPTA